MRVPGGGGGGGGDGDKNAEKKGPSINQLFDILDTDKNGTLTKEEVISNCSKLNMTPAESAELFEKLDKVMRCNMLLG